MDKTIFLRLGTVLAFWISFNFDFTYLERLRKNLLLIVAVVRGMIKEVPQTPENVFSFEAPIQQTRF